MDAISYSYADKAQKRIKRIIENPDSNSGIVTVPKVIASGETVTIPAGRVAVLPNVQVDGTLNIDGEVFIPSGATLSRVVETEGDQTISDVKTFLESPIVPTATEGNQAVNLETANSYDLGVGQTWQNVGTSRSAGVTYTNSTQKPIAVNIVFGLPTSGDKAYLIIDGLALSGIGANTVTIDSHLVLIYTIPSNATYQLMLVSGATLIGWQELR